MSKEQRGPERRQSPRKLGQYWIMGAVGAVVLAGAIFGGVAVANLTTGDDEDDEIPHVDTGEQPEFFAPRVNPAWPKPDFVLTDTNGEPYDIQAETAGYVTVLILGYTNCPDECPTHLLNISRALEGMDADDAEEVKVLFVTTDPQRDSEAVIRDWLDNFNTEFVGLTGSQDELNQIQRELGISQDSLAAPYEGQGEAAEDAGEYLVQHSVVVYAFDKDTNLSHIAFPHTPDGSLGQDEWVHDLTKLVDEGWQE